MTTQLTSAKSHFKTKDDSLRIRDIKLFPGSSRDTTAEQMAEQVNRVIAQLDAGDYEIVSDNDE